MNRVLERPVVRTLSWHEVGLEDGRKGRPYTPPEDFRAHGYYRAGYAAGRLSKMEDVRCP
jgi:hypothetical protein